MMGFVRSSIEGALLAGNDDAAVVVVGEGADVDGCESDVLSVEDLEVV